MTTNGVTTSGFGVTTSGFARKHLTDLVLELQTAFKDAFGQDKRVDAKSPEGIIIGIVAQPLADAWEMLEAVYNAFIPAGAEGASLDAVLDLIGLVRKGASSSQVHEIIGGSLPLTIPQGAIVKTSPGDKQFQTVHEETITWSKVNRAVAIIPATTGVGQTFTVTLNGVAYSYVTVGTSGSTASGAIRDLINAGSAPVDATATLVGASYQLLIVGETDPATLLPGSFSASFSGPFTSYEGGMIVDMESVETGEIAANAGTLTSIVTNVAGWTIATNPLDAVLGTTGETDTEARARRAASIAHPGASTPDAIRAKLLAIAGVTHCAVLQNVTDSTDADGLPPHSVEAIVLGGPDDDVARVMWEQGPAGTYQNGTTTDYWRDSEGELQVVRYTRPTEKPIWVKVTITSFTEEELPSNPTAAIKEGVLAFADGFLPGADVMPHRMFGSINSACPGIRTLVVEIAEDSGGSPGAYSTAAISVSARELATFATGRVSVVGP